MTNGTTRNAVLTLNRVPSKKEFPRKKDCWGFGVFLSPTDVFNSSVKREVVACSSTSPSLVSYLLVEDTGGNESRLGTPHDIAEIPLPSEILDSQTGRQVVWNK